MPDEPKTRAEQLQEALRELINEYNTLREILQYIPLYRLSRLINLIVRLIDLLTQVPEVVWNALFAFVTCNNERLWDLTKEQLRQLVETLKNLAELEKESAEESDGDTGGEQQVSPEALDAWIQRLDELLAQRESQTKEQFIAGLVAAKEFIAEHHPEILDLLVDLFGESIKNAVGDAFKKSVPGLAIRTVIKMIVRRILVRRLGEAAAKRLMPMVGMILTLIEFTAIIAIILALKSLEKTIDDLMAALVKELIAEGVYDWPTNHAFVWFQGDNLRDAKVSIRPFVHCYRRVEGELVRDENPCQLKFASGDVITVDLTRESSEYKEAEERWEVRFAIDDDSLNDAPCVEGAALCYIYLDILITRDGKSTAQHVVIGAKNFE